MSIKSAPFYWLECDNCGKRADYGEFVSLEDEDQAISVALDSEWTTDGERYHCPDCPVIARCENCDKPAGDDPLERDNLCQPCYDAWIAEAEPDLQVAP